MKVPRLGKLQKAVLVDTYLNLILQWEGPRLGKSTPNSKYVRRTSNSVWPDGKFIFSLYGYSRKNITPKAQNLP